MPDEAPVTNAVSAIGVFYAKVGKSTSGGSKNKATSIVQLLRCFSRNMVPSHILLTLPKSWRLHLHTQKLALIC